MDHYLGIDVGTGSARACVIDGKGDIVGLASENIGLWQPQQGYYVGSLERPSLHNIGLTPCTGTIYDRHMAMHLHFGATYPDSAQY